MYAGDADACMLRCKVCLEEATSFTAKEKIHYDASGCRDHAVPQEALDVTVRTRDSHHHGAESRASSGALLEDVVALWRPQVSKDCPVGTGLPRCNIPSMKKQTLECFAPCF